MPCFFLDKSCSTCSNASMGPKRNAGIRSLLSKPIAKALITGFVGLLLNVLANFIWDSFANLDTLSIVLVFAVPPFVVFGIAWGVAGFLAWKKRIEKAVRRIELAGLIGYYRGMQGTKRLLDIKEKHRSIVLEMPPKLTRSITENMISRRDAGPPIDQFTVLLATDRKKTRFDHLQYKVLSEDTACFDIEEKIVEGPWALFIIHNRMRVLIEHNKTVRFAHSTTCDLDEPRGDWIGIETGGEPDRISIKFLLPLGWAPDWCHAFQGTPSLTEAVLSAEPKAIQETLPGESGPRHGYYWYLENPDSDDTYFLRWEAHQDPP